MGTDSIDNRTSDTIKMLNYGFNNYKLSTIYEKNKVIDEVKVEKGKLDKTNLILMNDATELLNINEQNKTYTINIKVDKLVAPLKKGQKLGIAEIIDNNGNIISNIDITTYKDIEKANIWDYLKRNIEIFLGGKSLI